MNGMSTADAVLAMLRGQVTDIVVGTIFLSIGATACAIAAIRWRRGVRILVWWGIFSGMYGGQTLGTTYGCEIFSREFHKQLMID
jgi:hypothetical protein